MCGGNVNASLVPANVLFMTTYKREIDFGPSTLEHSSKRFWSSEKFMSTF